MHSFETERSLATEIAVFPFCFSAFLRAFSFIRKLKQEKRKKRQPRPVISRYSRVEKFSYLAIFFAFIFAFLILPDRMLFFLSAKPQNCATI